MLRRVLSPGLRYLRCALVYDALICAHVEQLQPWLLGYAVLYNLIPLLRWVQLPKQTKEVEARNSRRKEWATYMRSIKGGQTGGKAVQKELLLRMESKLRAAEQVRDEYLRKSAMGGQVSDSDIAYSTGVEEDPEAIRMKRFDERLKKTAQQASSDR